MARSLAPETGPLIAGLLLPPAPLAIYAASGALLAAVTLVLAPLNIVSWRPAR